jgi:hypothetical protein
MRSANQLTFTTYEASLKLKSDDPTKIIFDRIDWSFIHPLVKDKYSPLPQGADGYDPISLFKAQLLIYLGEVNSDRKLVSALCYNGRLCLLCGFNLFSFSSGQLFRIAFRHYEIPIYPDLNPRRLNHLDIEPGTACYMPGLL